MSKTPINVQEDYDRTIRDAREILLAIENWNANYAYLPKAWKIGDDELEPMIERLEQASQQNP